MFPLHRHTLHDLCGGSGIVSLNHRVYFKHTFYNEYCKHIYRLFHMLRDLETRDELIECLVNAPCNEAYFNLCKSNYNSNFDSVEDDFDKAVQTFVLITQSYMNCVRASWAKGKRPNLLRMGRIAFSLNPVFQVGFVSFQSLEKIRCLCYNHDI